MLWPPNAVLLTALLLSPRSSWWVYLVAVAPADRAISWPHVPWLPALGLYVSNVGQSVIAASLLRWSFGRAVRWDRVGFVLDVAVWAAIVAPMIAALSGAAAVHAFQPDVPYWTTWRAWASANALTNLLLVPAFSMGILNGSVCS